INYRYGFELGEFNKIEDSIKKINEMVKKQKDKIKSVETLFHSFEKKVDAKKERLTKEITKLELLKEEFNPLELEENISNASKYEGVLKDLDAKKYSRLKLKEEQTSALKELEQEIEQLEYKIKNTIPNEVRKIIYNLEEMERNEHQSRRVEIEKEFENLEAKNSDAIKKYDAQIEELKSSKNSIESKVFDEQRDAKERYEKETKKLEFDKKTTQDTLEDRQNKISKLKIKKRDIEFELDEHEKKYKKLRAENAKELASKKRFYDNKIANAKAILYPPKNSLNEFLSNEIDGWEESVYPIIDKDLLKRSCDELNPQVIDATNPIGFKLDTKTLSHIPTKDEALKQIEDAKYAKRELLRNSKKVYKTNISNLDEKKNEIISNLESSKKEIDNLIDENSKDSASLEKIYNNIKDKTEKLKVELDAIESKYKKSKDELLQKMHSLENLKKEMRDESQKLSKEKQKEFAKNDEIRDFNLNAIRKKETTKGKEEIKKVQDKIDTLNTQKKSLDENEMIYRLSKEINLLEKQMKIITDAIRFLEKYDEHKDEIEKLPLKQSEFSRYKKYYDGRKELVFRVVKTVDAKIASLNDEKNAHESRLKKYDVGIKKVQTLKLEIGEEMLECEEFLVEIIEDYENILSEYRTKKSKFRELIDRLKKLESHSIIELNFNLENFSEVKSIGELDNILDSLSELDSFEKNKYESEKKRAHNNFDSFLRNTIPSKLQSFDDLENEFEKAKNSINKSLSNADFGVIKEIRLVMDSLKNKNDSIASLLQELSKKVRDTTNLYSNKSLFYFDVAKSVGNIEDIKNILEEVKKKGSNGSINLFDTIDLSISYVENGRKVENKLNIKDESSSGGNILLKVAIAMSILNRYAKKTTGETPFFLIIDEVSKLQSKNQELIRSYINENGFKTLFITPDPAYPDPKRAIYYTFKNIQEEGEHLEIRQMNII
ncbi:MAG: ATP-binding protein, partial [Campylobacterales bacterium]|nr:ATP-binding protein [Campylobacterales bacterium]